MAVNLSPLAGAGWQLLDNSGNVLTGGKLFTYAAGTTTPQATYTTSAGNIANSNPVILDASGRVAEEIWLTSGVEYKFLLKDSNDVTLWTKDNISGINDVAGIINPAIATIYADFADSSNVAKGDALVGFKQSNSLGVLAGSVGKTVHDKFQEAVSVFDFMTPAQVAAVRAGTSTEDLSLAFENAINTSNMVRVPKGTYLVNVEINSKVVLVGDGSLSTIIKPFNYSLPAMTYTFTAQQTPIYRFWDYHSEVRNIGFRGTGVGPAATGIGFSFGSSGPDNYVTNAEYANNVTFYNCDFTLLNKGVQFPFGNIGTAFYSCGFQSNYYGVYMLDNKSGSGDPMHAGNKYFYNGEMSGNVCAVYINNATDGFGAVSFTDTIFEFNNIVYYLQNTNISTITPMQFKDCWCEANATLISGGPSTVTIDVWTGNVKTTASTPVFAFIIYNGDTVMDGGFVTGVNLTSNNSRVYVKNSRVETLAGFNGQNNNIVYADSNIFFENCTTGTGFQSNGYLGNAQAVGFNTAIEPNATGSLQTRTGRFNYLPVSYNVLTTSGLVGPSETFETAQTYTGTSAGTGAVITTGAPKYQDFNRFTFVYASTSEFYRPTNASISAPGGNWVAFTCDVRINSATGNMRVNFGDLSTVVAGEISLGLENIWRTIGGVAFIPNTTTLNLNFGTFAAQTAVIDVSAFQCKVFTTQGDAANFIASRTYLE